MPIYLPMAVKNIGITLEDVLSDISNAPYKLQYYDKISSLYRQLGIGEFLMSNDPQSMFTMLRLGIQAYADHLKNADTDEKAASRVEVFFDSACCQDQLAMKHLALLSPFQINTRKEYEEDFYYIRILMDVFGLGKSTDEVRPMLDDFEALHIDNSDERFSLLCALLEKDGKAFHESLEVLIDERLERYADGGDLYKGTHNESAIFSHVSTEVMAWLWFARRQDIGLSREYALAPSSAMAECKVTFPYEGMWRSYEAARSLRYTKR